MKPSPCLVFDANIVIHLFEQSPWSAVLSRCELVLTETVVEEADFYRDAQQNEIAIDLEPDIQAGRIKVVSVAVSDVRRFQHRFDPVYLRRLDDGETESLVYCLREGGTCRICSADAIVFKVLALLDVCETDVSLEELLQEIGLARSLPAHFSKRFRLEKRAAGLGDRFAGIGLKAT